jgi:hypothetical protein
MRLGGPDTFEADISHAPTDPLNMRLGGPDTFGADISHALTGIKPGFLGRPACNLEIVPNTPYLTGVKKH